MGSSLDSSLVDRLLPTIDALRSSLLPAFGVRQHVVRLVTRTWSGTERGEGDFVDVEVTMNPPPQVEIGTGSRYDLRPQGREEDGTIKISEISLSQYQENDLTGGELGGAVQFFWLLRDAHGQGVNSRAYVPSAPPVADREHTLGWVVYLRRAEGIEPGPTW